MKNRITVVGSINMDLVVRAPRMPLPGETLTGRDFHMIPGGKGANQAVAAARLGALVTMVGHVGSDDFGRRQQQGLHDEGIDVTYVTMDSDVSTGIAMITLDEEGQNSIVVSPEANGRITPSLIDAARDAIAQADLLICQLEIPIEAVARSIEIAQSRNVPVLLNPAPARKVAPALLKQVSYLIPNEFETQMLTGMPVKDLNSARAAVAQLQPLGIDTVIMTLGGKGALVAHADEIFHEEALSVDVIDTTAAGDCFIAGFGVALLEGNPVKDAVRFANYVGALAVTKLGAQSSIPTRQEVDQFIKH